MGNEHSADRFLFGFPMLRAVEEKVECAEIPELPNGADPVTVEGETCCICLEPIAQGGALLPCQHKFCFACAFRWAHLNNTCPLCRCEVHNVQRLLHDSLTLERQDVEYPVRKRKKKMERQSRKKNR